MYYEEFYLPAFVRGIHGHDRDHGQLHMLEERGAHVSYHDPWVPSFREHGVVHHGVDMTNERLQHSDVVVLVTDHSNVDYQAVADHAPLIMDARNAMARTRQSKARVVPLSAP